ncbi:MAG TPA: pentapeptide repeat-containing protein [Polyangiaceae bacterium]|nr:pentapeptide repeat-containing protein [Polyangiaceae bacterium]
MNQVELNEIVAKHKLWLNRDPSGARANLAGANLADANLADANLADAYNLPDGTQKVDPPEPYTRVVDPARYGQRAERYRQRHPDVPVVPDLDRKILSVVESGAGKLDMSQWHSCETTHCRAGWAITLAGDAGRKLEAERGPAMAGHMIYMASTGRSAHFYATTARAMEDMRHRAAEAQPA